MMNNCNNASFDQGESACNGIGGHLVTYASKADQEDVEGFYTSLGARRHRLPLSRLALPCSARGSSGRRRQYRHGWW